MNTPTQQAELYRKAAETIEMCAEHGIEPMVKFGGVNFKLSEVNFVNFKSYEFPLAVIEGQLVWDGDELYGVTTGEKYKINKSIHPDWITSANISWNKPKQPLCEVEGKPVYKGDKLWFIGSENVKAREITVENYRDDIRKLQATDTGWFQPSVFTWSPPKRTVMVELTVDDAEAMKLANDISYYYGANLQSISNACKKALDNLK